MVISGQVLQAARESATEKRPWRSPEEERGEWETET